MKAWLKNNASWLLVYCGLLLVCLVAVFTNRKEVIHLAINKINSDLMDGVFPIVTLFGEFPLILLLGLIPLFVRYRIVLTVLVSSLLAVLFTQVGKRLIWPNSPRPSVFFKDLDAFHVVEGVHLHSSHSFPSGHTSGAFALFIVLALYSKSHACKLVYLWMAVMVAYSRIYLSQHFLVDVAAGSFFGVIAALLAYAWFNTAALKTRSGLDNHLTLPFRSSNG